MKEHTHRLIHSTAPGHVLDTGTGQQMDEAVPHSRVAHTLIWETDTAQMSSSLGSIKMHGQVHVAVCCRICLQLSHNLFFSVHGHAGTQRPAPLCPPGRHELWPKAVLCPDFPTCFFVSG